MSDKIERGIKDLSPEEKRALLAQLLKEKASQTKYRTGTSQNRERFSWLTDC